MNDDSMKRNLGTQPNSRRSLDSPSRQNATGFTGIQVPEVSLPTGGGAIRGIEEKFQVNAINGTSSFAMPIPLSPSRHGFTPAISLNYNSGVGNGPFGVGWDVGIAAVTRKTERQLPQYRDEDDSDTFVLSGAEDLVPLLEEQNGEWTKYAKQRVENGSQYTVTRYRPRIEGAFSRIEKWKNNDDGVTHWRTITRDNIHAYYGLNDESRVSDPQDATRVFKWLLCRTHNDKGSSIIYRYKKEDFADIPSTLSEKNRVGNCTQVYIKKVLYGNRDPYYLGDPVPAENDFLFKVIFDYGEHDPAVDIPKDVDIEKTKWKYRNDAFSSYRSGFEIRTYRRCRRVLLFHCFDAHELPHSPYLVKSLELSYQDDLDLVGTGEKVESFSHLSRARQNGHTWQAATNSYSTKHLPEFEFEYQQHEWNVSVEKVTPEFSVHAPSGIADKRTLWIDLFSEGISGILSEQGDGWFYKSNLGNGRFSQALPVAPKPSFSGISSGVVAVQELEGNGIKCLVQFTDEPRGFFRLTPDEEWEPFRSFDSFPNVDPLDPNARSIDLNGDGLADLLITEENEMRWYPGAGEKGFSVSRKVSKAIDEEMGPAILFEDRSQSIFLADLIGDGLTDIVRIRNGEVCYWPNLGYGRFGAKVAMADAPEFDHPDAFNPSYLRLADIDGSGTIDIVYLGKNDFRVWMNLNGNAWTQQPRVIEHFPNIDNLADVMVVDFLGSGTACIVYSSPLPQQADHPLQYIDLMGGKKPHLLRGYHNHCGSEVSLEYKTSTHFYLEDKRAGKKWITKLPFPVHCISNVRTEDRIRDTVFTNSYRYSHGYYDHHEREFRGFARVEQLDTEEFGRFKLNAARNVVEESLHQPPVRSVAWFHTGAFLEKQKLLHQCDSEYFQNSDFAEYDLSEPRIDDGLDADELREALRACKGLPLRTELYAEDDSPLSAKPYSASQSTVEIRLVQPKQNNDFASFMVVPTESISYGYERNPGDPRISHSFVIDTDDLGKPTKTASVVYPRVKRPVAPNEIPNNVWAEQSKLHVAYGELVYTNDVIEDSVHRIRVAYESKSFEISGIALAAGSFINRKDITDKVDAAEQIAFETEFDGGLQKRLVGHTRAYFVNDNLGAVLPLGEMSKLAIWHKNYRLAFTDGLVSKYYGARVTNNMLSEAGYVHSEGDVEWWAPSGTAIFDPDPKNSFYIPIGTRDVFGNESLREFDGHTLLSVNSIDAIGNKTTVTNDYRTLSASMLIDPNLNRAAVETDELGLVTKSAVMGKEGAGEGDTLADPTIKLEYDLFTWKDHQKPNFVRTLVRERHGSNNPRWQESYSYSDGGGNVIMAKSQAEPGKAMKWNPVTQQVDEVDANPRWVANGRTMINNKGNPIKQYDSYFSATHEYESEDALVETGVTSITYYDPIGRDIRTENPNGTFSKIEFDSWYSKSFDVNDTVKESQWYNDRGSPEPTLIPEPADPEQRAAWLAAKHSETPGLIHSDSLGRTSHAITDYGDGKTTIVYSERDMAGRYTRVFDQLDRKVSESFANLLGASIYGKTAEKGERWIFSDVRGRLVKIWDNDVRELYGTYDELHRPVSTFVKENGVETLFGHVVYGDLFPDAEAIQRNLKGKSYQLYDQAGVVTLKSVDFKGNALEVERRLTKEYKQAIDWKPLAGLTSIASVEAAAAPMLEVESFSSSSQLDALNRPTLVTLPDQSVVEPKYNEANYLESLRVRVRGEGDFITFLENQDYDAKGQRQFAHYGNGLMTSYFYDPKTFRLVNLVTKKAGAPDSQSLQNLHYTFDPVGNIVHAKDDAQQTHYFNNAVVKAESNFEYDSNYQLLKATGREHAGLGGNAQRNSKDLPFVAQLPHANHTNAVRNYTELYDYDDCGNVLRLRHVATNASWTQHYRYAYQDDPNDNTNRLNRTSLPGDADGGPYSAIYQYDIHGNMTQMPHLDEMVWNFMDQLAEVDLGGGGRAFYIYGLGGSRIRKVIERLGGARSERIYLGAVEIYRDYQGNPKKLERSTLHVSDNVSRIAQIDTKMLDVDNKDTANPLNKDLIRYQYTNHLGSATMETDDVGKVISYEDYHPYGSSAYRSSKSNVDLSLKRYRFSGKERDDETGFYYFGARYYAAWLGRWVSSDPAGFGAGLNTFKYCSNNPIMFHDPSGTEDKQIRIPLGKDASPGDVARFVRGKGYEFTGIKGGLPEFKNDMWHFGDFTSIPKGDPLGFFTPSKKSGTEGEGPGGGKGDGGAGSTGKKRATPGGQPGGTKGGEPGGTPGGVPGGSTGGDPGGSPDGGTDGGPGGTAGGQPGDSGTGSGGGGDGSGGAGRAGGDPGGSKGGSTDGSKGGSPGGEDGGGGGGGSGWFKLPKFLRGVLKGVLITIAVIAVVATAGAALAAIAPAAAAAISGSAITAGILTTAKVASVGIISYSATTAVIEGDSERLGEIVGSLGAGAFARPISAAYAGATRNTIRTVSNVADDFAPNAFALPGGGTLSSGIAVPAEQVVAQTVSPAISAAASNVLMMAASGEGDGSGGEIRETFDSFEAATGNVNPLKEPFDKIPTKSEFWKSRGFTEKWIGQNPDTGEWFSAFHNPSTGQFSGGKLSGRNWL